MAADLKEEQRLDAVSDEKSSQSQGMRRLKMSEMVQLMVGDEVCLVVPPSNHKVPKAARQPRRCLLSDFRRVILSSSPSDVRTRADRDDFMNDDFLQRTVHQSGMPHIEFNVRVAKYLERSKLSLQNPLKIDVDHWLGTGNLSIYLELCGHGSSVTVPLKLADLPYVQVYKVRNTSKPFIYPSFDFSQSLKEDTLARKLAEAFHETRGDASATVQVMLSYYKHVTVAARRDVRADQIAKSRAVSEVEGARESALAQRVLDELNSEKIYFFLPQC